MRGLHGLQIPMLLIFTLSLMGLGLLPAADSRRMRAFPGAEGFGAYTPGGRGGRVIEVTNLNADGPGSLRQACEAKGPRIVVFRVSGVIHGTVPIREPYITIAGQTAPGDGVCIRGLVSVGAHDVILRYLRVRPGDGPLGANPEERDRFAVQGGKPMANVIIDHCSASWGVDENISVYGPYDKVTVQWCITSEALCDSIHTKGPHGMGMILGAAAATQVSVHHCLFAHNLGRTPLVAARREPAPVYDLRNNVAYSRFQPCIQILGHPSVNVVGCVIKRGAPADRPLKRWFGISPTNPYTQHGPAEVYVEGNQWPADPKAAADPWTIVAHPDRSPPAGFRRLAEPIPAARVSTQPAAEALESVLKYAGCTRPARDVVDQRIVEEVRAGTGDLIDSQEDVGGWPTYVGEQPPADADHDGMPDVWETLHDFDSTDPKDGPRDKDGDGYTNVEEYLNATDPSQPDGDPPIAHRPVKLQAGNDHIRGEAARRVGAERLTQHQKPNGTVASAEALVKRVKDSGQDAADLLGIKMVQIEPGEFDLGKIRFRVTHPFLIATTEVAQAQWETVMGTRPWLGQLGSPEGADGPANYVNYIDAQELIRRLNACGGARWRLPTHAEWRLAAHGGTAHTYGLPGGEKRAPEYACCCYRLYVGGDRPRRMFPAAPRDVAQLKPNPFGLHDLAGNVQEWVSDFASHHYFTDLKRYGAVRTDPTGPEAGTTRTICGGHFRYMASQLFDHRPYAGHKPHYRGFGVGFRLARDAR